MRFLLIIRLKDFPPFVPDHPLIIPDDISHILIKDSITMHNQTTNCTFQDHCQHHCIYYNVPQIADLLEHRFSHTWD